jgi:hypothetical protein
MLALVLLEQRAYWRPAYWQPPQQPQQQQRLSRTHELQQPVVTRALRPKAACPSAQAIQLRPVIETEPSG